MTDIDRLFIAVLLYLASLLSFANEEKFGTGRTAASVTYLVMAAAWLFVTAS